MNEKPLEVAEPTLDSYDKVNPTSLLGSDVQHTQKIIICFTVVVAYKTFFTQLNT